jgi:hypothetical protein
MVGQAARDGFDRHAWQLPLTLTTFFDRRGYWRTYPVDYNAALAAARRLGDRNGQALVHQTLGHVDIVLGSYRGARKQLETALAVYRELGDRAGQGHVHIGLGYVHDRQGVHRESLAHCMQAHDLYLAVGDRTRQASTLNNIGWCHAQLGDYQRALACCEQARDLHQELGDTDGEASSWDSLGYARHRLGQHAAAIACYERARPCSATCATAPARPRSSVTWATPTARRATRPRPEQHGGRFWPSSMTCITRPRMTCGRGWPPPGAPCRRTSAARPGAARRAEGCLAGGPGPADGGGPGGAAPMPPPPEGGIS